LLAGIAGHAQSTALRGIATALGGPNFLLLMSSQPNVIAVTAFPIRNG
jgi:hypothetical protein